MDIRKPHRISRTYVQKLAAEPARVFPLLCPVREADWLEGWDPLLVLSESGVAEPGCIFVTEAKPANAVWCIVRHDPGAGALEMLKITPEVTACQLGIRLQAGPPGTHASVTYAHTSLGPAGDHFLAEFTQPYYERAMRNWETRLNHYLSTGTRLSSADT